MSNVLQNTVPSRGGRKHFKIAVDENGIAVSNEDWSRAVLVMFNLGPNDVWANTTLETATPESGTPLVVGGGIVDTDSGDAWYFRTASGESADIRGWEIKRI